MPPKLPSDKIVLYASSTHIEFPILKPEIKEKTLNVIDLFCGCGGMSLGFQNAGFKVTAAFDNWAPAINVYKNNFEHHAHLIDLDKPEAREIIAQYNPALIIGGPPCQDFSSARMNITSGKRASLTTAFATIVTTTAPAFFVLENVPRIVHTEVYKEAKRNFNKAGYGMTEIVVDASYCGVPQSRKRIFLIGGLHHPDDFLKSNVEKNLTKRPMTMRDYFGNSLNIDYYFRIPTNYTKRAVFSVDEPCKTIRAVDRPIPPTYKKHPSDSLDVSDNVRTLTILERSYVQTFPKEFKFYGTKTNLNHMIGNAVPVKLAEFIATTLADYLSEQSSQPIRQNINRMKVIDLFSGCGGLSKGFINAGFDVLAGYENWSLAADVYARNFNHPVHCLDLSQITKAVKHIEQYAPDVIIAGPPCQDFSIAGKRQEESRADLTIAFAKIASKLRPTIIVMENVFNITRSPHLKEAIRLLRKANYGISSRVIDASLTGVPQRRKRYFLIALLNGSDNVFNEALDSNLASEPMTVRKFFGRKLKLDHYYAHPRNYKRRAVFSVDEPSATIRRVNRPIPKTYVKHPADKADVTEALRPLTTKERSFIQTFPEDFIFLGTPSQQEHLIGNAVPIKLAEYVAKCILQTLNIGKRYVRIQNNFKG